jgi:hypothetical protein
MLQKLRARLRRPRRLPPDPALFAWLAVALFALLPLGHAVASGILTR